VRFRVWCIRFVAGLYAVSLLCGQNAPKKTITIDDLIAQRGFAPLRPIWRPDGMAFAYVEKGAMHLYDVRQRSSRIWFSLSELEKLAKPAVGEEQKPYNWQNRHVASETYEWFPNGRDLLALVHGELFVIHGDGKMESLTSFALRAEEAKLSPNGRLVVYRVKSNLYVLDLASKKIRQLTDDGTATLLNGELDWVYPEELYLSTAIWWSPDSTKIAYLQFNVSDEFVYPHADLLGERAIDEPERYPQAGTPNALVRLGVVSAQGGGTRWIQAGNSPDILLARVAWLPDSSLIALECLNRVQNQLDLLFCNPATGKVRKVLHEQSETWINIADNFYPLHSRPEFLWTSERSGFRHIYRYGNDGKLLGQVTSGNWEVRAIVAVDEAHGQIDYTSSETSPLETQLYRVGFDGGPRTRITSAGFNHLIHSNQQGSYYLDTYSSLKQPPQTVLRDGDGRELAVLQPADREQLTQYDILPTEIVEVKAPDGTVLYARLIKPAGFRRGVKYPAIVYVYGGPQVQSVVNEWNGINWEQVLAHRGYVIWQLDNRGSYGRGHAFESVVYHELGKQEVADQRLGVEHLIQMGFVDPKRIGITGWSYGGYMTIHCLLWAPDLFQVGVAGAPVTDWHNYDTIYTERYMGLPSENAQGYDASSNVKHAAQLKGKLFIVHNFEDDNVLFQNTMQLVNALEKADKQYFLQLYPQKTHGVFGPLRKPMYEAMTAFFDTALKPQNF
jgi:dipeptidyl-peptidase-4